MAETRDQRFRRLRRARRAFRRWTVLGAGLTGATAVLTPYAGLGLPDAAWAGAAGVSVALAVFRWRDYRALAAAPLPAARPPQASGESARAAIRAALGVSPTARAALDEMGRRASRRRFRDSSAAPAWARLDAAAAALTDLHGPLGEQVSDALQEASAGERSLRELAGRILTVERALRFAGPDTRQPLAESHALLMVRLEDGVSTFERLVAAAAASVAENGVTDDEIAGIRLADAADRMAAFAQGLSELRDPTMPIS